MMKNCFEMCFDAQDIIVLQDSSRAQIIFLALDLPRLSQ